MRYVREYVHAYLNDTLEEARGHIQEYADSFSHTMQAAVATQEQGALRSRGLLKLSVPVLHRPCCCLLCCAVILPCLGKDIGDNATDAASANLA